MNSTCMSALVPGVIFLSLSVARGAPPDERAERFDRAYAGADLTGDHVLACWTFESETALRDMSSHGHDLTLRGESRVVPSGRFGAGLECFPSGAADDRAQGALAQNHPSLTPAGAFSLEAWIKPKPEFDKCRTAFIIDKKYYPYASDLPRANHDYCLYLTQKGQARRRIVAYLGYGDDSAAYYSDDVTVATGTWYHIAFIYDGRGTGRFFLDGREAGSTTHDGRGAVSPGPYGVAVGCRYGSVHESFPGFIDQVRICNRALQFSPIGVEYASLRHVFVRMEKDISLRLAVVNRGDAPLSGANVHFSLEGSPPRSVAVAPVAPGSRGGVEYGLDTRLRPGAYTLKAAVEVPESDGPAGVGLFDITIVERPRPYRMPVVMWGAGLHEVDRLKEIGFTHAIGIPCDMKRIRRAGEPATAVDPERLPDIYRDLDYALANGIGLVASLSPGAYIGREEPALRRIDANGKPYVKRPDVCAAFPEVRPFCYDVGASVARTYGAHPAWQSVLVDTEVRDHSGLCYHEHDHAACRAALGFDIPEGLRSMRGTPYGTIEGFPADRVIPDDYPLYRFYRWWWKEGDGWNGLHTAVHEGVKSGGREDVWTFHDPAVRVASTYGNGGNVDVLSHWTYSYPDPPRIGLCTDELFAMAGGSAVHQRVMKMTQIIWYRSQTAPAPGETAAVQTADFDDHDVRPSGTGSVDANGTYRAAWEKRMPDARFITIAPMHLREAFWSKISRPIQGIMYHGWQSLVECPGSTSSYRHTHPETKQELERLVHTVVEPLGPTLMQVPDRPGDVAFLESFASQMFAGRGTYGWNGGWAGDAYLILLYAQLQPRVVYEETVVDHGLSRFKVLVMVDCDVLPRSIVDRVNAFQANGGIVIGDENLCPAVKPDILLPRHERDKRADVARAMLLEKAKTLRAALDTKYARYAWSENPNVITRVRRYGTTDYLFAVNDLREFGDYVGHHGLVMENGLPSETVLCVRREHGCVYPLVGGWESVGGSSEGATRIPVALGPCEGRLFMITERAIQNVEVKAPERAVPGGSAIAEIAVLDGDGKAIDGVMPLQVDVLDPHGRRAEFSGSYGAGDGRLSIRMDFAPNDVPGVWQVRARDRASGLVGSAYVRVEAVGR